MEAKILLHYEYSTKIQCFNICSYDLCNDDIITAETVTFYCTLPYVYTNIYVRIHGTAKLKVDTHMHVTWKYSKLF